MNHAMRADAPFAASADGDGVDCAQRPWAPKLAAAIKSVCLLLAHNDRDNALASGAK